MKLTLNLLIVVILLVGSSRLAQAQLAPNANEPKTDIATLFVRDPLTQSVCFRDGGPSGVFQNGQLRNRCSDLNFNSYVANGFKVGIEGGRDGIILDLGTPEELKTKYGFSETVGGGQGFASISVNNGKALILKDYKTGSLQELTGTTALFGKPTEATESAPVKLGHIYLVRITDRHDKSVDVFAKVLVVAHVPNESVTVRWQLLGEAAQVSVSKPAH